MLIRVRCTVRTPQARLGGIRPTRSLIEVVRSTNTRRVQIPNLGIGKLVRYRDYSIRE